VAGQVGDANYLSLSFDRGMPTEQGQPFSMEDSKKV
jgi:hypothetical protein